MFSMKKEIIYSYITSESDPGKCKIYVLVPLMYYDTHETPCTTVSRESLEGRGKEGLESHTLFRVPGLHKKTKLGGPAITKTITSYVNKKFWKRSIKPGAQDILYGYTGGTGRFIVSGCKVYALVPRASWSIPKSFQVLPKLPRGLKLHHRYNIQDIKPENYYIIYIQGITECTSLELYSEDLKIIARFEATLTKV